MTSPPDTPKRRSLRSLFSGSFSRSRSRSPSQSSQTSTTGPSERPKSTPGATSSKISPVATPRHSTTIPTIIEPDGTNTGQTKRSTTWTALQGSLEVLRDTVGVFPPLSSAAGILLGCIDGIEAASSNRKEFEDLSIELIKLSEFLAQRMQASGSYSTSKSFIRMSKSIEQQAQEIKGRLTKVSGRGLRQATLDEEDLLRHYRQIESLFRQLQTDASMSTWSMVNEQLANTRLEGLNPAKQATYDSNLSMEIDRRTCTDGTRIGVLAGLNEWQSDPSSASIYWMNGMVGTGKTTIACTFCEQLESRELLAASFFCTRSSAECHNVTRIIPTIAYQLARYSNTFKSILCEVLDQDPDIGMKNITKQFEQLLKGPLARAKGAIPGNLVVVIDALDECEDRNGVERLLDMLFQFSKDLPLKFLVTSRPEPEIYQRMTQHAQSRLAIHLHDIEKSIVQADIELYLKTELSSMTLSPPQVDELVRQSGALFTYAAALVRYIKTSNDPQRRLKSVLGHAAESTRRHAQIDALYTAVLKSALSEEELEADEAEDVQVVLRTVLFAQEPISIETIATLAKIDDLQRVECALQPLRSVLHHSEQTGLVSTLHGSFPGLAMREVKASPDGAMPA